ncbi:MAG: AMP-binding protein [Bacteroidota bacterium]|nr:MAG: AMP-binding protein [Bacteroidota bacterium]
MKNNLWILERIKNHADGKCLICDNVHISYADLHEMILSWNNKISEENIRAGEIVSFVAENKPEVLALIFALILNNNILVPLSKDNRESHDELIKIAEVNGIWEEGHDWVYRRTGIVSGHDFFQKLPIGEEPGLILFTSGSTGSPKAALHSLNRLMMRYRDNKKELNVKTLLFLKLFHIGGIHTLFSFVLNGGTIILTEERTPEGICRVVERYGIELLPTTPTFLNMLILSRIYEKYNLSTLKTITYGAEPMPNTTLSAMVRIFPNITLKQTYGFTELGILSTKSKSSDSLWIQINNKSADIKIVDNILFVRNNTSMIGYLNAPSPIDADGWFNTGDLVEVEGEFIKILGRKNEIINVGGEKVFPAHVENVLLQMPEIAEVVVSGKKNPITGNLVTAAVTLNYDMDKIDLVKKIREFCKDRLEEFEIPRVVHITNEELIGISLKKKRIVNTEINC